MGQIGRALAQGALAQGALAHGATEAHDAHLDPPAATIAAIAAEQLEESLSLYGVHVGLRVYRKHLAWYLRAAPLAAAPAALKAESRRLCQADDPRVVFAGLAAAFGARKAA